MKETNRAIMRRIVVAALAFALMTGTPVSAKTAEKSPALAKTSLSLTEGKSKTLKVKKGTYKIIATVWSTSNKKAATVSQKGKVTAKAAGKATIKAVVITQKTKKTTKKYTLKCKVTVKAKPAEKPAEEWVTADTPEIDEESTALFQSLSMVVIGANYQPVAKLAKKTTEEGMLTRFFAKETLNNPKQYVILELLESKEGAVTISEITHVKDVPVLAEAAEAAAGSLHQCESPALTEEELAVIDRAMADFVETYFAPVAKLFTQAQGKDKEYFAVLCESAPIVSGAVAGYSILYFTSNAETGEAELDRVVPILEVEE